MLSHIVMMFAKNLQMLIFFFLAVSKETTKDLSRGDYYLPGIVLL